MMGPMVQRLLAQAEPQASSMLEFDWPESGLAQAGWLATLVLLIVFVVWMYLRDTASFSLPWRCWLLTLRLGVVVGLAIIVLNPSRRTPEMLYRPSQLAVLVDTSLSMGYPPDDQSPTASDPDRTRMAVIRQLLSNDALLDRLQQDHQLRIFTFDSRLEGPHTDLPYQGPGVDRMPGSEPVERPTVEQWNEWLRPRGLDTRLGDGLRTLIGRVRGRTLAGVLVLTDGESNAGFHPDTARDLARSSNVRLVSLGVGGTQPQQNLKIVGLQAPTDVHLGDPYDIKALVQGQGFANQDVVVELLSRDEGDVDQEPTLLTSKDVRLMEDGAAQEVQFNQVPTVAGTVEYFVRVRPSSGIQEWTEEDNERRKTINLTDRKTRILMVAGGPLREYRFVRNMVYRHKANSVDVVLQSVDPASFSRVSQESDQLLPDFPATLAELDAYDVVLAFDADWLALTETQRSALVRWVNERSGGLIAVAGDIHTPELAGAGDELEEIRELYPVFLNEVLLIGGLDSSADQVWNIGLTREGREAGFMMLDESPTAAVEGRIWDRWEGVYRAYPTAGAKAGATIFAYFTDVRKQTEHGQPILMASQFFGSGRTFFLGTNEFWRMRSLSEEYYERLWTKLIREVGKGRRKRGTSRGVLMVEREEYALGQTVRVRAKLYDRQLEELDVEGVDLVVENSDGREILPRPRLTQIANQPGEFAGDFRVSRVGPYRIQLQVPEGTGGDAGDGGGEVLTAKIDVRLPDLESEHPEQNVQVLKNLVADTGGQYLQCEVASDGRLDPEQSAQLVDQLAQLFPNKGEEIVVSEWPETLWDRAWVLYALVGLLSLEWLTRKLLKLA